VTQLGIKTVVFVIGLTPQIVNYTLAQDNQLSAHKSILTEYQIMIMQRYRCKTQPGNGVEKQPTVSDVSRPVMPRRSKAAPNTISSTGTAAVPAAVFASCRFSACRRRVSAQAEMRVENAVRPLLAEPDRGVTAKHTIRNFV
jgi:hypothetical protein